MNRLPAVDMTATGANILQLRRRRDLTVRDLQAVFGFSTPQAIYNWQRGRDLPSVDNLVVLSAVLGVTMDEIVIRSK
ncbi:MAG: helix-turn-helix transcriptional regulator [Lachnospiraceae bacterium]|nr:helix-turn-helix transcriptional regulator [Lachnospiraceae bacterium]